ncbi:hypothetical protein HII36_18775 [Nonomuraea sp. NN258]|uniref:penicillin-binding transpeptidase domain-containing protein n=1 Tax=Nonomuraea antri TaxID=2730852 RepID=UPI001567D479|nr:penicillin-binding transpeptidase domain-containing protein [Nonomuraea antri]NRQ33882.1 hypothetical protein [Nonomuraea antri]
MLVSALLAVFGAAAFAILAADRVRGSAANIAAAYFAAWRRSDFGAMARLVDRPPGDFVSRHFALSEKLHVESLELTLGQLKSTGENAAEVPFGGVRTLREFGAWPFESTLRLGVRDRAWKVIWAPETLHPLLKDGGTLELNEIAAAPVELVTREGSKIPNDSYAEAYLAALRPEFESANHGWELVAQQPGRPPKRLKSIAAEAEHERTTLSRAVQAAAARALDDTPDAAIIALRPSTGEILALADRLTDNYSAIEDVFPPGSTFKTITAAALLGAGMSPSDELGCPGSYSIPEHQPYVNDGEVDRGLVSFADAFAYSCNTTFVEQATTKLTLSELREVAEAWGFARPIATGVGGTCGSMEDAGDLNELALDAIGQGTVQASPLCMAAIAAAVQNGTWRSPRLLSAAQVRRLDSPPHAPVAIHPEIVAALREMMAAVVDHGTAGAAGLPEGVAGKTGTAEVEGDESHAWFIGYRGDLAFCVFVRNGGGGGAVAAPLAARFLNGL